MAIVKMNKFTLLAFESQKEKLVEELQSFGEVQFINLQDENFLENNEEFKDLNKYEIDSGYAECDEDLSRAKKVLEFLNSYVPKKSGLQALKEEKVSLSLDELKEKVDSSNWYEYYEKVRSQEIRLGELETKKSNIQGEIDIISPWRNFDASFDALNGLNKTSYFLGTIPKQYEETLKVELEEDQECYFEFLNSTSQEVYIFVICHKDNKSSLEEKLRLYGYGPFNTKYEGSPIEILNEFEENIAKINNEIADLKTEISKYVEEEKVLQFAYEYFANLKGRMVGLTNCLRTNKTVVIQGWVPKERNTDLTNIIEKTLEKDFFLAFEEVKDEEIADVPVKLTNNAISGAFESVTEMYSLPRYNEVDPTPVMAPFYLLFFGMMIADVGYGLIMLIGALIAIKLFKNNESNKNFAKFFAYLSVPSILFGFLYGSFFSDIIKIPGLINPSEDVTTILIMSVVFGIVQIFVGLGVKAYSLIKAGDPIGAFYDVGSWYMILIGLGLMLGAGPLGLPPVAKTIATVLVILAALIIVLTNGRAEATRGARLGQGAYALYGITGYVGDLVSYTRLMALGLAGGSIAGALNLLIRMLPGGFVGIILTAIAFIAAHTFNLLLSLLGAYVHTARLQYVEYFSKFYEGGGKPFTPFRAVNKYINLGRK